MVMLAMSRSLVRTATGTEGLGHCPDDASSIGVKMQS